MRNYNLMVLAAILGSTAFGYVVTNVGIEHQGILKYDILYSQVGGAMKVQVCREGQSPTLSECSVIGTLDAKTFNAALASPAPFGLSNEPMIPETLREAYQGILSDSKLHNLRLDTENTFEDKSLDQELLIPLFYTPTLLELSGITLHPVALNNDALAEPGTRALFECKGPESVIEITAGEVPGGIAATVVGNSSPTLPGTLALSVKDSGSELVHYVDRETQGKKLDLFIYVGLENANGVFPGNLTSQKPTENLSCHTP